MNIWTIPELYYVAATCFLLGIILGFCIAGLMFSCSRSSCFTAYNTPPKGK